MSTRPLRPALVPAARLGLLAAVALTAAACTCGEPPKLTGDVVDPWGNPVAGLQVTRVGTEQRAATNAQGQFALPLTAGSIELEAAGDGYLPGRTQLQVAEVAEDVSTKVRVIPEPDAEGYHLVGPTSYLTIAPQPVVRKGNDLQIFHGIQSSGEVEISGEQFRVVFHTELKLDEVARLGIELHRLSFVPQMEVSTVEGVQKVDVNLWTTAGTVPFERESLPGGKADNYIFRVDGLEAGTYAFVSMGLLDAMEQEAFDKVPQKVRRIHPFTVK
jgi:hypothetical protein